MADYASGVMFPGTLPDWQQKYYSRLLLETLRMKSILVPYCIVKTDHGAVKTGVMVYTEVFDLDPDFNALNEETLFLQGGHLDSRTVQIQLEIHGDLLKFHDYNEIVQYVNKGDIRGLVRDKIGQNQVDYLDILARNAFAAVPSAYKTFAGGAANRAALQSDDYLTVDLVPILRTRLEDLEVPGVQATQDSQVQTLVMTTTPRVIAGIRSGNQLWQNAQEYAGSINLFNGEVGTWDAVRFVRTNRLRLYNAGAVNAQSTLAEATTPGQGAARTVDSIYTVGQGNAIPYVTLADVTGFEVGQNVTIHSQALGAAVLETDGTQETRRIVEIDTVNKRLKFNKPLMKGISGGRMSLSSTRPTVVSMSVL